MQSKSIVFKVVTAKIKRQTPKSIYVNKDIIFKNIEESMKKMSAEMNYKKSQKFSAEAEVPISNWMECLWRRHYHLQWGSHQPFFFPLSIVLYYGR